MITARERIQILCFWYSTNCQLNFFSSLSFTLRFLLRSLFLLSISVAFSVTTSSERDRVWYCCRRKTFSSEMRLWLVFPCRWLPAQGVATTSLPSVFQETRWWFSSFSTDWSCSSFSRSCFCSDSNASWELCSRVAICSINSFLSLCSLSNSSTARSALCIFSFQFVNCIIAHS